MEELEQEHQEEVIAEVVEETTPEDAVADEAEVTE